MASAVVTTALMRWRFTCLFACNNFTDKFPKFLCRAKKLFTNKIGGGAAALLNPLCV
jgi:hypothetical protein